jgi:hypothetical protein
MNGNNEKKNVNCDGSSLGTLKVKSKTNKYLGSVKPKWLVSVVSNLAKVAYA